VKNELTPSSIVRHALARAVSAIADLELSHQPALWPELMPALYNLSQASDRISRESGIYVLYSILDTVTEASSTHLKDLFKLFSSSLNDPESPEVRITTLRGLAKIAENIEGTDKHDIKAFQELVVPMLRVLGQAVNDDDTEGVKYGFDVFETLLILDTPLVSKHVAEMTQFFLGVASNKETDEEMRCGALNVLSWIVR
jgi:hypothetical protein